MRAGRYADAIAHYAQVLINTPALGKSISANLSIARQKYRNSRQGIEKQRVAVCGWELAHNPAGRAYTLATLYETFADVEIIGSIFPRFGREVWEPIRNTRIPKHTFLVEDESRFIDQAIALVAAHPYDIVHLSKPRAPNIFFGILYKLLWDAKVVMDIDDEELGFVGADSAISVDDYLKQHGQLPGFNDLAGKEWTRLAVGLADVFDGVTVSNPALQQRYGGEIIRHARDENKFHPSPELTRKSREKFGIPQDKKVVLFFGTPREHKGLKETAEAIAELKRDDILFVIVGDFPDSELKRQLQVINGCRFSFIGNQPFDAIPEVVSIADCCVLLQGESLAAQYQVPAKLSDALGMGVPVFASDTPALEEFFGSGAVEKTSSKELKDKLSMFLLNEECRDGRSILAKSCFASLLSFSESLRSLRNRVGPLSDTANRYTPLPATLYASINSPADLIKGYVFPEKIKTGLEKNNQKSIDIIVPVYNALEDVQRCLDSLERHTDGFNVSIIVVNDGSDSATTNWLKEHCAGKRIFKLIEHLSNQGYTKAVNTGLRASNAPYVITQNSDTIATSGWLQGLVRCMESDPKLGIVGPLSNAASWQNVPVLKDETGAFAVNELPQGLDADGMARLVAEVSERSYPRLPFVNGFCFMIRRAVLDSIGHMDEENFPVGYGEENDFCIRAADAGYTLAIADDVYVFHAKSKSFGHEKRKVLSEQGTKQLKLKHSARKFDGLVHKVKRTEILDGIRLRVSGAISRHASVTRSADLMSLRVLFLLPVTGGGGGAHSVVQEASAMRGLGIYVRVAIQKAHLEHYISEYADIPGAEELFVGFDELSLVEICARFDVLIGTIYSSMRLVKRMVDCLPTLMPAYYVQDYEPLFFERESPRWRDARDSYTLVKNACLFAKTHWIIDQVREQHGVDVNKVEPSIDHQVYRPRLRQSSGRIHLAAMIRPQTPIRGAERTMRLLSRLYRVYGDKIYIQIFGCPSDDPAFASLVQDFPFVNHGPLKRPQVASLLAESDLFLDLSDYQAFGRTALEAMACHCAAIVPAEGGAYEYAVNDENSLILNALDENKCWEAVNELLSNPDRLFSMRAEGLRTASRYSIHRAAISEILMLREALARWRGNDPSRWRITSRTKLVAIPSSDRHGVPLGSGFVRIVLPYHASAVLQEFDVTLLDRLPEPQPHTIAVVQRQVPSEKLDALKAWVKECKRVGMKVVHDIDDDLLDADALRQRGYSGDVFAAVIDKVRFLVTSADLVLASTEPLAKKIRSLNANVCILPNALDANIWRLNEPRLHDTGDFAKPVGGPVRIGYIGTPTHDADLIMIADAMRVIKERFGNRVQIEVIGGFENVKPLFGERIPLPRKKDYPNFVNWLLQRVHWDIGLIPLVNDDFNKSKSYLKFLECGALDMAMIVSDVPSYSPIARHGHNCLLAQATTEDWVEKLSQLVENESLRQRLSTNARKECAEKHTFSNVGPRIVEALKGTF